MNHAINPLYFTIHDGSVWGTRKTHVATTYANVLFITFGFQYAGSCIERHANNITAASLQLVTEHFQLCRATIVSYCCDYGNLRVSWDSVYFIILHVSNGDKRVSWIICSISRALHACCQAVSIDTIHAIMVRRKKFKY